MEKITFNAFIDDELSCRMMFKEIRESRGIICRKCGPVSHLWNQKKWLWQCKKCSSPTTLRSGTILMHSNLPFSTWFKAIKLIIDTNGSISSLEVKRHLNYKRNEPIWYMIHKIRTAMGQSIRNFQNSNDIDWMVKIFDDVKCEKELRKRSKPIQAPVTMLVLKNQNRGTSKVILAQAKVGYQWTSELSVKDIQHPRRKQCLKSLNRFRSISSPVLPNMSDPLSPQIKAVFERLKSKLYQKHRGVSLRYLQKYLDEFSFISIFDSFQSASDELISQFIEVSWGHPQ